MRRLIKDNLSIIIPATLAIGMIIGIYVLIAMNVESGYKPLPVKTVIIEKTITEKPKTSYRVLLEEAYFEGQKDYAEGNVKIEKKRWLLRLDSITMGQRSKTFI